MNEAGGKRAGLSRREVLAVLGAGALVAEQALLTGSSSPVRAAGQAPASPFGRGNVTPEPGGYAPNGTAGRTAALPLQAVELLASPFSQNQQRNTTYLLFLDPERMLRSFRLNYGLACSAQPCGGWERPVSQVRGHTTGHLLSGLALTYANTGNDEVLARGRYLVGQLAMLQARARQAGFHSGYLSAFPEVFFDWLEEGKPVWSPYYMIHKYLAGMIDQYQLAGDGQALDVAVKLGDWVDWRTARLPYAQMQMVLQTEFGGLPEALANLYTITGSERYLAAAQRFYHAQVLDPLAAGVDALAGLQANVTTPKIIACVRMWEETGSSNYRDIAQNFWDIVTAHHIYVIGGAGNYEHFQAPGAVAGQLSNFTCENCVSYNLLKLTRLLHFHQPSRIDLLDYYERTLFNQMLGEQDPHSPHGFNCYYTGLSPGAFKRQPLNYFPDGNPGVYATDYDTFTCDTATGLETQAKFADTIYTRGADGITVNLFIPSQVRFGGLLLRQATGFPDDPVTRLSVVSGTATMTLRVRVPGWVAGPPAVTLNGALVQGVLAAPAQGGAGWIALRRQWRPGDLLEVTLPMRLAFEPTPDYPDVQAVTCGPVVLSGVYPADPGPLTPVLDVASVQRTAGAPMTFGALSSGQPVTLIPVARAAHEYYSVYWQTA
ncbi:MAG TPA: beta-L-arabinofuranosidase domain-containing protein [Streptosporangiaceae bacterium]|nr:beta-L-arabinofuranosidase domain-containing protein [Streptosporangiaceae bacterium]